MKAKDKNKDKSIKGSKTKKRSSELFASLKKYREIIISIILFMLVNITILSLNYYQSFKVEDSAIAINMASQEAGHIQDIAKNLTDINLLITQQRQAGGDGTLDFAQQQKMLFKQFNALKDSVQRFDTSLNLLQKGGNIKLSDNTLQSVNAIQIPSAVRNLDRIETVWTPFKGMIQKFLDSYDAQKVNPETVAFATDYARIYTTRLLLEINDISDALQVQANEQAKFIKTLQIVGIVLALSIFLFMVFRALRALLRSDIELAKSRRETTEIMNTIAEGLFLIDENYQIGEQQSRKLASIFPIKNIAGKKLDEVLEELLTEKDLSNTRRFINQLFNRRTREQLIDDLNPLRRIHLPGQGDEPDRYLRFQFTRAYEGKKIQNVLVSIIDITETVEIEQQLEKERRQNEQQYEMLIKLLRIDPTTLAGFMNNAEEMTQKINQILEQKGTSLTNLEKKRQAIFREVHNFKGEASALELTAFVRIADEMEDHLNKLKDKPDLNGNDFLKTTISLEEFFKLTHELNTTRQRLVDMNLQTAKHTTANFDEQINHFAHKIAQRQHKNVDVKINGFTNASLPAALQHKVKDITIQLLRNAVVHGIESEQERIAAGKSETGHILVSLDEKNAYYQITVEDDGAGINKEAIRQKLVDKGICSQQAADNLDEKALLRAIFLPGFSTYHTSDEDAGRGVGMDVVKDRIQSLGGKMNIDTKAGQYSRFTFYLPKIH